ncbi:uncharacterized protein LOC108677342 isoform X2 [Hyalella azteca]|uniref:Uncharacterized protein LOC108677342 isoform X2 n=1 Tax=Hyalella azteca TaxID=294128 RepID=A0A8B7P4J1_HYAAZ|nr:uncharacterized protein LOC108677342 isoform X2 [Hyalella azteca]
MSYQPTYTYNQPGFDKDSLDNVLQYIRNAPNYCLYKIQQCLPNPSMICTYDPMVWLPPELLDYLLLFLDPESQLNLLILNKAWNRYLLRHPVWQSTCQNLGVSKRVCYSLGCPENSKPHLSWLQVTIAAFYVRSALCKPDSFFLKKCIPVLQVTRLGSTGPLDLTASGRLICAYRDKHWVVLDRCCREVLLRHTTGSEIMCTRFIDTSKAAELCPNGAIIYGKVDGRLTAALQFKGFHTFAYIDFFTHAGPVLCCDASAELDLMVSAGDDLCIRMWHLSTGVMLMALSTHARTCQIRMLPKREGWFNVIAVENTACRQYKWTSESPNSTAVADNLQRLNSAVVNTQQTLNSKDKFGNYLNIDCSVVYDDDSISAQVIHDSNYTIGCISRSSNEKTNSIVVYDAHTLQRLHCVPTILKLLRLEAAGRRFALFTTTSWSELDVKCRPSFKEEALVLFDLTAEQQLSFFRLPWRNPSSSCRSYDTAWLDELPVDAVLPIKAYSTAAASASGIASPYNCTVPSTNNEPPVNTTPPVNSATPTSSSPCPDNVRGWVDRVCKSMGDSNFAHDPEFVSDILTYRRVIRGVLDTPTPCMTSSSMNYERPLPPVLYISHSGNEVVVVTWNLQQIKAKGEHKTKTE